MQIVQERRRRTQQRNVDGGSCLSCRTIFIVVEFHNNCNADVVVVVAAAAAHGIYSNVRSTIWNVLCSIYFAFFGHAAKPNRARERERER